MLSPLMFAFQTDDSPVFEKDILGHKIDKRLAAEKPIWSSKGFIYISKRRESTYNSKFSKKKEREISSIFNRENCLILNLHVFLVT